MGTQCAAMESDEGAGRALGISAAVTHDSLARLQPVIDALEAARRPPSSKHAKANWEPTSLHCRPPASRDSHRWVDSRHYFDYHHTAADTLDKVDPANLQSQIATMGVLAYYLADLPECLPRIPVPAPGRRR